MKEIHWFPGHMNKALKEVEAKIKLVDVVVEVLDARAPISSINKQFESLIRNKKKIIVLSKIDLADQELTTFWVNYFKNNNENILTLNLNQQISNKLLANAISNLGKDKWAKEKAKGMKPQPIKVMIIGIPNVGKSSLINRFANRKAAGVQNKPGFTRGEQWIKVSNEFTLLDTPGILPMSYEDQGKAINLALIGSIKEQILPISDLSIILLEKLKQHYPNALLERFGILDIETNISTIEKICEKRKLFLNGTYDLLRGETLLLNEFKNGLLGRITLDRN